MNKKSSNRNKIRSAARELARSRYLQKSKESLSGTGKYPSNLYFVITKNNLILNVFCTLSDAREALHESNAGQYVARIDGAVMAYMSKENSNWRPIARVSSDTRRAMFEMAKLDVDISKEWSGPEAPIDDDLDL